MEKTVTSRRARGRACEAVTLDLGGGRSKPRLRGSPPGQVGDPVRAEILSWLFWQRGSAPCPGGGFGLVYAWASTRIEYAIDRFARETRRQLDVLDRRLAESRFLGGDDYTIADIAVWPWYGGLAKGLLYGAAEFLAVHEYKNVNRWADEIGARPAVKRGRIVNRLQGDPKAQLRERHDASDFELRTEDKVGADKVAAKA